MEHRYLGRSGLRVSAIGLGTMGFGGGGKFAIVGTNGVDEARPRSTCASRPESTWSTPRTSTPAARRRRSSARPSRAAATGSCSPPRRGSPTGDGPNDEGLSRHHLIAACEASLRRLDVDHIDLYQVHQWDGMTPLEETLGALETLVQQGKIRYVGCSNFSAWHVMKALGVAERDHLPRFVSQQIHYTPQAREAENELVPLSIDQGLGILVWSPLAGGLLSGKYRRGVEPPAGLAAPVRLGRAAGLRRGPAATTSSTSSSRSAEAHGVSAAQVTLAYLLAKPGVTSVIVGARTEAQLADNLAAADLTLTPGRVRPDRRGQPAAAAPTRTGTRRRPCPTGSARPTSACSRRTSQGLTRRTDQGSVRVIPGTRTAAGCPAWSHDHSPSEPQTPPPPRPLLRSRDDRVVAGVAGGLGRWLDVDPVIFRVTFAVLTLFGGIGVIGYLIGYLFIPDEASGQPLVSSRMIPDLRRLTHAAADRSSAGAWWPSPCWWSSPATTPPRWWSLLIVAAVVALTTRGHQRQTPAPSGPDRPIHLPRSTRSAPPPGAVVPPSAAFSAGVRAPMPPSYATPSYTTEPRPAEQPWQQPVAAPPRPRPRTLNGALISVAVLAVGLYLLIGRAGAYDTSVLQGDRGRAGRPRHRPRRDCLARTVALGPRPRRRHDRVRHARQRRSEPLGHLGRHPSLATDVHQCRSRTSTSWPLATRRSTSARSDSGLVGTTVRVRMGAGKLRGHRARHRSRCPPTAMSRPGEFIAFGLAVQGESDPPDRGHPRLDHAGGRCTVLVHLGAGNAEVRNG